MDEDRKYLRFPLSYRIEHWVLMLSFTVLAITGLVQKYASASLSEGIVALLGGVEQVRIIHRSAAIVLMLEAIYHVGVVGYRLFVHRVRPTILLTWDDGRVALQTLLYNLGLRKERPLQGRYTVEEKIEYWAVVWGTLIMAVTGFMMWNPIATTRFLPGEFVPAAKAAHGNEALLAVLAILAWHVYHVHLRHFNKSIFTGYLTEVEMQEEHPLELTEGEAAVTVEEPKVLARRRQTFFAAYGVLAAVMLVGIYLFVTLEETAITTVPPPEQVVVYAPLTPTPLPTPLPTPTPLPQVAISWEGGVAALLQERCDTCHNSTVKSGGLDLSSYERALTGGASGPAIVPGDPTASLLVARQATGDHPGQLSGEELALIRRWIEAGAPER